VLTAAVFPIQFALGLFVVRFMRRTAQAADQGCCVVDGREC
jgi:hypothetical protein